jgi:epoxide hydrolase 4
MTPLENEWTLLTIPQAGHFVQHQAAEFVTRSIVKWLDR